MEIYLGKIPRMILIHFGKLRKSNPKGLVIAHPDINSIRNKFDSLKFLVAKNVDILVVSETKIDGTFPPGQFLIEGFKPPLRYDRNQHGGGILVYIREGVPSKELKFEFSVNMECIITEINLHKKKWAMLGIYRPPTQDEKRFYEELGKAMDHLSDTYENFLIVGDFNNEESDHEISNFLDAYGLKNLIKAATCIKSNTNPRTIDLILTNRNRSFSNTQTTETGLSDFHLMVSTVLKSGFVKRGPKIIHYRDYSKFDHVKFKSDLREELSKCYRDGSTFDHFNGTVEKVLNKHAPLKKKSVRANDGPFMTKALRKAIMLRTRLRNMYNKCRTQEKWNAFKKQRNKCVKILRQAKVDYNGNLDLKDISDNRKFWKTVKPLFMYEVKRVHIGVELCNALTHSLSH